MARRVRGIARGRCTAVTATAVLMLGACAPSTPTTPSPEPTVSSVASTPSINPSPTPRPDPTPTPTPDHTPSPSSTLNEEQTAAKETVLEFFRLKNELSKDLTMEVQPLVDITTGQTQTLEIYYLGEDRDNGVVQTGDDLYYVTDIGPVSRRSNARVVAVDACTDSRDTDLIVQETGKSILGSDRAYFVEWHIEVLHEGDGWKVGDITSGRVVRCGP